jgi:Ca2+-binding EF-hand superfamily protein
MKNVFSSSVAEPPFRMPTRVELEATSPVPTSAPMPDMAVSLAERTVSNVLREQLSRVLTVENAKIDLASRTTLNLALLFQHVDKENKEYVNENDVMDLCDELGMVMSASEMRGLFANRSQGDLLPRLRFGDFTSLFISEYNPEYKTLQMNRFITYRELPLALSGDEKFHIRRVLHTQFAVAAPLRRPPSLVAKADVRDAFRYMDADYDGYIGAQDMKRMMSACGIVIADRDLQILLKVYDKTASGRVSSAQFMNKILGPQ